MIFDIHYTNFSYYFVKNQYCDSKFRYYDIDNWTFHPDFHTFKRKILKIFIVFLSVETKCLPV